MSFYVQTGVYIGNGTTDGSRAIPVGFQPKALWLHSSSSDASNVGSLFKTADMAQAVATGAASNLGAASMVTAGNICSFSSSGFNVGGSGTNGTYSANVTGVVYYFTAIGGTDIKTGTYTGNAGTQSITGVGFLPAFVMVSSTLRNTCWKISDMSSGTNTTNDVNEFSGGITSLDADGFSLDSNSTTNGNTKTYYYLAIKANSSYFKTGFYLGNGTDNRNLTGVGFQPDYVLVKQQSAGTATQANIWHSYLGGDNSLLVKATSTSTSNSIQGVSTDGFQVGTSASVNTNASGYYYFALKTNLPAITDNLVSYWKMDEVSGTTASDSVGSNNGTLQTGTSFSTGKINNGINTPSDGSTGGVDVGLSATLDLSSFPLTVMAWFKTNANLTQDNSTMAIYSCQKPGTNYSQYSIWMDMGSTTGDRGKITFFYRNNSGTDYSLQTTQQYNDNNWHHVAGTIDGSGKMLLYIDGILVKYGATASGAMFTGTKRTTIGCNYSLDAQSLWIGTLDEVGVWSRALSGYEINKVVNSGTGNQYPFTTTTTGIKYYSGTYTGNGADTRAITGIGFKPKVLMIASSQTTAGNGTMWKTDTSASGNTSGYSSWGENGFDARGSIYSLDSDGFTLGYTGITAGGRDVVNQNGSTYYYIALAGVDIVTGIYTGDGTDNRSITGVGFQPEWVVVQEGNQHTYHKSKATGIGVDSAQYGTIAADASDIIQSLDQDGFTLGAYASGANINAQTGYFFAIRQSSIVKSGSYTGDGNDNRSISGVGFQPKSVFIKQTSTQQLCGKFDCITGDNAFKARANVGIGSNIIQALETDGFQIGTDATSNNNGSTYYYLALKESPVVVSTGNYNFLTFFN